MRTTVLRIGAALGLATFGFGLASAGTASAETLAGTGATDSLVPDLTINVINAQSVNVASPLIDLTGTNP
ncbi:hypothetical protein [Actinokineospora inagensis]|uniref:hypothetical protein n=1 Tax=Actinokineospora inagensis TaxID=103730 RepID=UPI00041770A6|nr:hypothetical protein [Actinokineospora inagensis]